MSPRISLDPARGAYYCEKCRRYFDDPFVKYTHEGVDLETCPHCKAAKIIATDGTLQINDLASLERAKTPRPRKRQDSSPTEY